MTIFSLIYKNKEFISEVKAISKLLDIEFGVMLGLNFMYEIFVSGCTSVMVRNKEGNILFGRNMDYEYFDEIDKIT